MPPEAQKRILIIRLSAIGDVLRVLPALEVIRKNYPGSYIGWVVEEPARDILEAHPDIDELFIFPKKSIVKKLKSIKNSGEALKDFSGFMKKIREKKFDMVIDFHGLFKSGIISYLSGAPERIGFTREFTKELNFVFNNRRFPVLSSKMNRVDRNLMLLEGMGLDTNHKAPPLHIPDDILEETERFFRQNRIDRKRPVIAVHPGTSPTTPYKRWDPYRYAVVADSIIENSAAQIVYTWGGREIDIVKEIIGLMKYRAIVAPETRSLCHLAAIFKNCDLYLGSDTGPMHLASFTGIPVVAIFGPTNHRVNEPYSGTPHIIVRNDIDCSPCRKTYCSRRDCMKGITEEKVIMAVNIMLDSVRNRQDSVSGQDLNSEINL